MQIHTLSFSAISYTFQKNLGERNIFTLFLVFKYLASIFMINQFIVLYEQTFNTFYDHLLYHIPPRQKILLNYVICMTSAIMSNAIAN